MVEDYRALFVFPCRAGEPGDASEDSDVSGAEPSMEDTYAEHRRRHGGPPSSHQHTDQKQHQQQRARALASAERQSAWRGVVHSVEAEPESLLTIRRIVDTKKRELDDLVAYLQDSVGPTKVRLVV